SGSGKSTLLRVLMLLESMDGGSFRVRADEATPGMSEASCTRMRRHFGMVFQQFNLFPHRTALQNVTLALEVVLGRSAEEARAVGIDLLRRVGLAEKIDEYPSRLSGGQKQRVAIARALAPEPDIMLFDEITSALDPELVGEVLEVLRGLARSRSTTMLIVTHEIGFAREMADRVLFFDRGRILSAMHPDELGDPGHPRVREFLRTVG
ncbi:MAG: amino acid ABC transporter ATP-binding protein, partial [Planctomycetes bacterium]|nr:amino acid ABC transporter ATP-binding protein [Planctomycetota bacterium]